jgi:uncharacterized protein YjdB
MKRIWKPAVALFMAVLIFQASVHSAAAAVSASSAADFAVSDYAGLLETVARQYIARDPVFTVRYTAGLSEVQNNIKYNKHLWDDIFSVDLPGTTSDLDYLRNNMSEMRISYAYSGTSAVCEFTQTYLTTASEENDVNTTVGKALRDMGFNDGSSVYEKIKAIHDYVLKVVDYDFTYSRYTAYDALYRRSAVCQGYALLMYKMLMDAGIPARFIYGEAVTGGQRGPHAWNIVKIGKYWYNLDATWDDSYDTAKYFLKSNASFSDHFRDGVFTTAAFKAAYPMSPNDFDPAQDMKPVSGIALSHSEGDVYAVGDVFMLSAVVTPADATDKSLSWSSSDPNVATVDSSGNVKVNGPGTAVITASANDGTGKTAVFNLTARIPTSPNAWAVNDINALNSRGVIPPELQLLYRDDITRAEFMALIANVYAYAKGSYTAPGTTPFTDIAASPYRDQIALCYQLGIIEGDGTLFRPDMTLTREQCAKIIGSTVRAVNGVSAASNAALPYKDLQLVSSWALPYIRFAYETGLMLGSDGFFNPQSVLTREQAMMVAERMIEKYGW